MVIDIIAIRERKSRMNLVIRSYTGLKPKRDIKKYSNDENNVFQISLWREINYLVMLDEKKKKTRHFIENKIAGDQISNK